MRLVKNILRSLIVLLAVALIIVGVLKRKAAHLAQQTAAPFYGVVPDFKLIDQKNHPVDLKSLKGQIWVASFIFTRCQGPCPMITTRVSELQREFAETRNLSFVSFTVDPANDTPAALEKYAQAYGVDAGNWHFLTGDKKSIYTLIRDGFHLAAEQGSDQKSPEEDFVHSTLVVLVDKDARIKGYYNSIEPEAMQKLRVDLKNLIS